MVYVLDYGQCTPGICENGDCIEHFDNNSYSCACFPGFKGDNCQYLECKW